MSENILCIGPVLGNPDTSVKLIFGNDLSDSKVLNYVGKIAQVREKAGFITNEQAIEMLKETEVKLKEIRTTTIV